MEQYSVLMSVYYKENPVFLRESIESMLCQTVPTNDFVLVCDGPLTPELDEVIEKFDLENPGLFQIVRLPQNLGIGGAANKGLAYCKFDLVAKMDADDVARLDRCEKQLMLFDSKPKLGLAGGQLAEFMETPDNRVAIRNVPIEQKDIVQYAKRRMPFNNQTVMYRKSVVESVGGYQNLRRCEDYDLFVRILEAGCLAVNCPDILVDFRLTEDAYRRRGMWANLKGFIIVRWRMYRRGFCSFLDFFIPAVGQMILSIAPNRLRDWIYQRILR